MMTDAVHTADVRLTLEGLIAALEPLAKVLDQRFEQSAPRAASVAWSDGRVTLSAGVNGCRLTLRAEGEAKLANLREAVGYHAEAAGIAPCIRWRQGRPAGLPGNMMLAKVVRNQRISPSFRRLRLAGDFSRLAGGGPHVRLNLGPAGAGWPHCDGSGTTTWPGGIGAWHRPPYTIRAMGADCSWIDIDVVLHDGGRVTDWLSRCSIGEPLALSGPGGKAPGTAEWVGYVGDETALPVIAYTLARLTPETRGTACLIVPDPRDRQVLAHPPGIDVRWLTRGFGTSLMNAITELAIPDGPRFVFVAGERRQVDNARAHLARQGLAKHEMQAVAYWQAAVRHEDAAA